MRYLVDELESLGYRWAYRLVDSRFTGVPQRRQRVIFVAALDLDPRTVLFADEAGEPDDEWFDDTAYGFYWTEGLRGVGWAKDAVPTLKAGSTIGIPSPPAIWNPGADADRLIVTPQIGDAEELQGFPRGWTEPAGIGVDAEGHPVEARRQRRDRRCVSMGRRTADDARRAAGRRRRHDVGIEVADRGVRVEG